MGIAWIGEAGISQGVFQKFKERDSRNACQVHSTLFPWPTVLLQNCNSKKIAKTVHISQFFPTPVAATIQS